MASSEPLGSAALAAQGRKRGPSVLERLRAEEDVAAQEAAAASVRSMKRRKTVAASEVSMASTDGMVLKTGMVLARAKLIESSSGGS